LPYADTDFFVALAIPGDRLHASALEVYGRYKGRVYTSLTTIIELALISKRLRQDLEELMNNILGITKINESEKAKVMMAVNLIQNRGFGVFDAFHAAFCDGEIISSDQIYDRAGIIRIKL
jgi:predicted nucleic acid-binding protein